MITIKNDKFITKCRDFYEHKTIDRINLYYDKFYNKDVDEIVNDNKLPPLLGVLDKLDWDWISEGWPTVFHGDLHFENILINKTNDGLPFSLLDWRQNFGGSDVGDVYYDLAKMYGGILMSYKLMKKEENFSCFVDQNIVNYDHKSESILNEFKPIYEKWIHDNNYDLDKVKLITSIIFLNMAPLHETEFGNLLFFKSKEMLQNDK